MKYILTIILISAGIFMFTKAHAQKDPWITVETTYEGFPLFLRHPHNLDINLLKIQYPTLLTITHDLDEVQQNGLPESEYNRSLFDFDMTLTSLFEKENLGKTVLVETFAGKRMYYIYIQGNLDLSDKKDLIQKKFPANKLQWEFRKNEDWSFISNYSKQFKLNIE
jgi:hypothetical protein